MKTYNIMDLTDATSSFDFKVTKNGVTTTIWEGNEFFVIVRAMYNHMLFDAFTVPDGTDYDTGKTAAKAEFIYNLATWQGIHGEDFRRAIIALYSDYNPIENYDRMEEGSEEDERHKGSVDTETITEAGTETNAHHKGSKVSTGEETIVTPRVQTKNTTYKVPFDSSTETETDALVSEPVSGTDKTERDATKNFTTQTDIDASTYDKDVREFSADRATTRTTEHADVSATVFDKDVHNFVDRRTHGNIGVTTTQQMIESEMDLRVKGFRESLIRMFIGEFCYYVRGVE